MEQTTTQLGKEFIHKIGLVKEQMDRIVGRIQSGRTPKSKGAKEVSKLTKLTEAIRGEYNRLLDEFGTAGV
jgi:hypothetical protein